MKGLPQAAFLIVDMALVIGACVTGMPCSRDEIALKPHVLDIIACLESDGG